jgi:hypothetical protein
LSEGFSTQKDKGSKGQRQKEGNKRILPLQRFDPLILCPFVLRKLNSRPFQI